MFEKILIANQGYLGPESGLARGFDDYTVERVRAPELNGKALAWIDTFPASEMP